MLVKTRSAAVFGIDAYLVDVEVDLSNRGIHDFLVVGLPDAAVKESHHRVRGALKNCGYYFGQSVTVNLAPADKRKEGSGFDLPMAMGILGALEVVSPERLAEFLFLGELSLDGSLRPVRGALPVAVLARSSDIRNLVVPVANAREAAVVEGLCVFAVNSLGEALALVNDAPGFSATQVDRQQVLGQSSVYNVDFSEVHGQKTAKRALEVAAGFGQDDAGPAPAHRPARPEL